MGRPKKVITETKQETQSNVDMEKLVAENQKLIQQIESMKLTQVDDNPVASRYLNEINKIKKVARVDTDKIKVKEFTDHKNISLWTKWGKRIGPLHQTNALAALQRFFALGIMLSVDRPTQEQIDSYNESPEGQKRIAEFKRVREMKDASKKKGNLEKLIKQMAEQYGVAMESIAGLLSPDKIKSVKEGIALSKGA